MLCGTRRLELHIAFERRRRCLATAAAAMLVRPSVEGVRSPRTKYLPQVGPSEAHTDVATRRRLPAAAVALVMVIGL